MEKKYFIIITGELASGKTTYGTKISKELNIPFFSKDRLKEILFDSTNNGELRYEEKRKIGSSSYAVLYAVAEELMKVGTPFILESNFVKESTSILRKLIEKYDYHSITIRFTGDTEVLHGRFLKREYSKERHQGLVSNGTFDKLEDFKNISNKTKEFSINDQEVLVDTTDFEKVDFLELMDNVYKKIEEVKTIK